MEDRNKTKKWKYWEATQRTTFQIKTGSIIRKRAGRSNQKKKNCQERRQRPEDLLPIPESEIELPYSALD